MSRQTIEADDRRYVMNGNAQIVALSEDLLVRVGGYEPCVLHGVTLRLPREVWQQLLPLLQRAVQGSDRGDPEAVAATEGTGREGPRKERRA